MTTRNLDALFAPRAIAMLGASQRPGSVGEVVTRNLLEAGFPGRIMLVNPKGGRLAGEPVHARVDLLPQTPDLAVIATPAETVPGLIAELGGRGCRAAIVISAGFEGPGRAAELRQAVLDAAKPCLLRVLGPNCLGLLSPAAGINASFAARMPAAGRVALVAQSGAVAAAAMDSMTGLGAGFSHVISVGDSADIDVGDLLDWLALDPRTDAILLYVEGVQDGRKFMSAARVAARAKPVAVLKAGRSALGAKAALSHTGALAGAFTVYEAVFRRAGLLQVEALGDLMQAGAAFAAGLGEAGERVAILTNGGGAGILTLDALDRMGESACELSSDTLVALDQVAPPNWSRRNPVDILGDARPQTYGAALQVLLSAPEADVVIVLNCPTAVADSAASASAVAAAAEGRGDKVVLGAWLGGDAMSEARRRLAEARLPAYATPEQAVRAYALLSRARRSRQLLVHAPAAATRPADPETARRRLEHVAAEGRSLLTDPEARAVLQAYGLPVVDSRQVSTPEAAGQAAEALGGPVALKILSRQISHKSDVGGVALDVPPGQVMEAARRMLQAVAAARPDAAVDGFTVEPMLRRPAAQEILAGVFQDPTFGPVIMVGQGGVAVEVLADRALGLPPLNDDLAREMIAGTRVSRLLAGYRGRPPADLAALSRVLVALGQLASDLPQIAELDINPLLCDADGVLAVDARIVLRPLGSRAARMAIVPYPADLVRSFALAGERLILRPVRPDDGSRLRDLADTCSPEDRRQPLTAALCAPSAQGEASLSQIDYDRQLVLVAEDGRSAIIGLARLRADPQGETAELDVLVRRDRRRQGLGGRLVETLLDHARQRGLVQVIARTDQTNGAMIGLARRLAFRLLDDDRPGRVRLQRDLTPQPLPA